MRPPPREEGRIIIIDAPVIRKQVRLWFRSKKLKGWGKCFLYRQGMSSKLQTQKIANFHRSVTPVTPSLWGGKERYRGTLIGKMITQRVNNVSRVTFCCAGSASFGAGAAFQCCSATRQPAGPWLHGLTFSHFHQFLKPPSGIENSLSILCGSFWERKKTFCHSTLSLKIILVKM